MRKPYGRTLGMFISVTAQVGSCTQLYLREETNKKEGYRRIDLPK